MAKKKLLEISENFKKLSEDISNIEAALRLINYSLKRGGKIIFCGNGGSAADAQHLAAELVGRYQKDRSPISAISLATDTSIITAVSNDYSFDQIFSRQIDAICNKNDVLYAISTSGKSKNIINAIETARNLGMKIIGLTGSEGGKMKNICDVLINVPSNRADRTQEMHIAIGHIICETLESDLC